ncbi:MAG: hypothetical protein ACYC61_02600 [Isosphaeraceae bacterium]
MTVGRRTWLLTALVVGLTGCRAANTGSLAPRSRPSLAHKSFDLDAFVAEHNRNAESIQSLQARSSITANSRMSYGLDGQIAMERPRNFKLELTSFGNTKGDIGSNDEEFWFWFTNKDDRSIYWCKYADVPSSSLPVTYQPDWIIEAMGLQPISREEASQIRVHDGVEPGTSILTFPVVRDRGEPYSREMIVGNTDHRIRRLILFSERPKREPIAQATLGSYAAYGTSAAVATNTRDLDASAGANRGAKSYLPQELKLEWKRDQIALRVTLKQVQINQFDHARSADLFVEPTTPGYQRRNLADLSQGGRPARRLSTRATLPNSDPDDGIQLGHPTQAGEDEPPAPRVGLGISRRALGSSSASTTRPTLDDLVGAPTPRPPSSGVDQASTFSAGPSAAMSREQ